MAEEKDRDVITGEEPAKEKAPQEPEPAKEPEKEPENPGKTEDKADRKTKPARKAKAEAKAAKDEKAEAETKIAELNDRLLRSRAEFENFRKRTEKEKAAMFEMGARSVIEKILPTIDNFERGLASVPEEQKEDAFVTGMNKVYQSLEKELEEIGVKPIESVGKEFDPSRHNAVMHIDDESVGENIVVEEFQKGYTYRDGIVRYSMVKVAN